MGVGRNLLSAASKGGLDGVVVVGELRRGDLRKLGETAEVELAGVKRLVRWESAACLRMALQQLSGADAGESLRPSSFGVKV